jgi:uncharacterized membrane protein (GlpM family)|tara:strand:- start:6415 stop:6765 length:351 start_codon:yes stop_codon:yes gene_type:complete
MYTLFKILFTAIIVVVISEIAKKSTLIAGIVASIPLTSLLAFVWLHFDTQDIESIRDLSRNILLMIPPSLTFFISLYFIVGWNMSFYLSLFISIILTAIVYWLYFYILSFLGIYLN